MPWMNCAQLISILRTNGIDPRLVDIFVEPETLGSRPRNPQPGRFESDTDEEDVDDVDDNDNDG